MKDLIAQYLVQLATVTGGAMALAEWKALPIGTPGSTRKRYTHLIYNLGLSGLGVAAGLVALPGDTWYANVAGLALLTLLSTALAHFTVNGLKAVSK